MDLGFFLRAQRMLGGSRTECIDYGVLVATLSAHQASSVTARIEARVGVTATEREGARDPLAELILAGPEWREAVSAQRGCFNRAIAKRPVNAS